MVVRRSIRSLKEGVYCRGGRERDRIGGGKEGGWGRGGGVEDVERTRR